MASKDDPYVILTVGNSTSTNTTSSANTYADRWASIRPLYVKNRYDKLDTPPSVFIIDDPMVRKPELIDTYDDVEEI